MPYPNELYFVESRLGVHYQKTPTGRPDINRLVQGNSDYWIGTGSVDCKLKKTLILADWSMFSWSAHKWTQVREVLCALIEDGFKVYLWQENFLKHLNILDLPNLVPRKTMIPLSLDVIYRDAASAGIARDETFILDDYWIEHLIHKYDELQPRVVRIDAFIRSLFLYSYIKVERAQLIERLLQAQPPISIVVDDIVIENDSFMHYAYNETKQLILNTFPTVATLVDYRYIFSRAAKLDDLLQQPLDFSVVESLRLYENDKFLTDAQMIQLNELSLLLTRCKHLQLQTLTACQSLPLSFEYLTIRNTYSDCVLQTISANNNLKLKSIELLEIEHHQEDEEYTACELPVLEEFIYDLSEGSTNVCFLNTILNAAPKLKRLTVVNGAISGDFKHLLGLLVELKVLVIDRVFITPSNLFELLRAAPNLEYLYFQEGLCDESDDDDDYYSIDMQSFELELLPIDSLSRLSYINVSNTTMRLAILEGLCQATPFFSRNQLINQIIEPEDDEPPTSRYSQSMTLDADTLSSLTDQLTLKQIFYPIGDNETPDVSDYRLELYNTIELNPAICSIDEAFRLHNRGELDLQPCDIACSNLEVDASLYTGALFYGTQRLYLSMDWQSLASLSPTERMLRYNTMKQHPVEIQYSRRDNLYYIRSDKSGWVNIEFTLWLENGLTSRNFLSETRFFSQFSHEELILNKAENTGLDYLEAMYRQKKGACRHRAFLFKNHADSKHKQSRIVNNDCHSFVEVYSESKACWQSFDLGGAEAQLIIDTRNPFDSPVSQITSSTATHEQSTNYFDNRLRVWRREAQTYPSPISYYQHCLMSKKRLIECSSIDLVTGLRFALATYCNQIDKPVFYTHSPAELLCKTSLGNQTSADRQSIEIMSEGKTLLDDFLTNNQEGVWLVNFSSFKPNELVHFNTFLDDIRLNNKIVIGLLYSNDSASKPGNDFYSRFDSIESCTIPYAWLKDSIPNLPSVVSGQGRVINFFKTVDWQSMLTGTWVLDSTEWRYQAGLLDTWRQEGVNAIEIQNGLWESEAFCHFWREAQFLNQLPKDCLLTQRNGYDWDSLKYNLSYLHSPSSDSYQILSPSTLSHFFKRYAVVDEQLCCLEGYIQQANSELLVYVTRTISEHDWAKLLTTCQQHHVKLNAYLAPGVSLPAELDNQFEFNICPIINPLLRLIQSSDVDATIYALRATHIDALVLDVTACDPSNLLVRINGGVIRDEGRIRFKFTQKDCALIQALHQGKTVILRGECAPELMDSLIGLKVSDFNLNALCIIVCDNFKQFTYMSYETHTVSVEEKLAIWMDWYQTSIPAVLEDYFSTEPFSKIQARYRYLLSHANTNTDRAWIGLEDIALRDLPDLNQKVSAEQFNQIRLDDMERILRYSPYVILTGLSGVGKSTFVLANLSKPSSTLYLTQSALLAWATDNSPGKDKILFLDEINLSDELAWLESVMHGFVLIDGDYYKLSTQHKVIGAMNPNSFGGQRKPHACLARHGNAYLFTPLPNSVLYQQTLGPLFLDTYLMNESVSVCESLFKLYQFIGNISDKELLISPRELQMIALLTISFGDASNAKKVAGYFAYHLIQSIVPLRAKKEFDRTFKPLISLPPLAISFDDGYLMTPSRQEICQVLQAFLRLQSLRRNRQFSRSSQYYEGLGGLMIEGEPGIGKSQLVSALLRAVGYVEIYSLDELSTTSSSLIYYTMPPNLNDSTACLLSLFHAGCVVILNEMNSMCLNEALLNDLLMGRTPDGIRALCDGFMVIATQNPISFCGRRATSQALNRRMAKLVMENYTDMEMQSILCAKGMDKPAAEDLIEAYSRQRQHAMADHLTLPTFRDVLRIASQYEADVTDFMADLCQPPVHVADNPHTLFHERGEVDVPSAKRRKDEVVFQC